MSTPNTLSAVLPTVYAALDQVSREMVGFIPAVRRNTGVEGAAKGQTITYPIVPAISSENITAGQLPADSGAQTIGSGSMTLSAAKAAPWLWNGEEELSLMRGDEPQLGSIQTDQVAQAFRVLTNLVEADLAGLHASASRAYGTSGTTPFATVDELDDASFVREILAKNGAPMGDLHLVLDTQAAAKLQGYQGVMFKRNEGQGRESAALGSLFGMELHVSNEVDSHTAGTGSSATTDNAGYAVGATTITLASAGTGTILAGDFVAFTGVAGVYQVATGDSDVSNGGTIVLQEPGLIAAIPASTTAITVSATYRANMAFDRNAIVLGARPPAYPAGGDSAADRALITDPVSGISFDLSVYPQYKQRKYELGLVWGVEAVAPRHIAVLKG